jgi:hypothetical protein
VSAAELDIEDCGGRVELNRSAHRRLDPELRNVDLLLQAWAQWARPSFGALGYPRRSVTERINEGGILAKSPTAPHSPEWPEHIVAVDREVAQLPVRHLAAIQAAYFYMDHPMEARQQIYLRIVRRLTQALPGRLQGAVPEAGPGPRAYREDLDRGRWTLRALLGRAADREL